jgi:hypothetical protein
MSGLVSNTPAPATPEGTSTTPVVSGVNTGITPASPTFPQADAVRGVLDLARDAGALAPKPDADIPAIAKKPMGSVTTTPDAKPMSVRGLANAAGGRR